MAQEEARLLKASAVAARWDVSTRWIYALSEAGLLPCVRLSAKAIRFRLEDIEAHEAARLTRTT